MKRPLLSFFIIMLVLLANAATAHSQTTDETTGSQNEQLTTASKRAHKVDPNAPDRLSKARRLRSQRRQNKSEVERSVENYPRRSKAPGRRGRSAKAEGIRRQAGALQVQLPRELAKHRWRVARLERIRELALKENATKTIERANDLLRKERLRYRNKLRDLRREKRRLRPPRPGRSTIDKNGKRAEGRTYNRARRPGKQYNQSSQKTKK